jgi:hypothetical protein
MVPVALALLHCFFYSVLLYELCQEVFFGPVKVLNLAPPAVSRLAARGRSDLFSREIEEKLPGFPWVH